VAPGVPPSRPAGTIRAIAVVVLAAALTGTGVLLVLGSGGGERATPAVGNLLASARAAAPPFEALTELDLAVAGDCLRVVVADGEDERVQGLRDVADLGPYDGMLFVFGRAGRASFVMENTRIPLDIGFYDASGEQVGAARMEPCPPGSECPTYTAGEPFLLALEMPAGDLGPGPLTPCP
jgi:uncharacterized membrane protein (UPF0127 family)